MSAVILEGEIVHYEVLGRGRPLIFLHGWVGSWRYWIPAMQVSSISFRAYALDLWGFGDTANKPLNYLLESQVRLVDRFLHELGIGKVGLVGHGLGAIVSLLFGIKYPDRVDRLMAISLPMDSSGVNSRLNSTAPPEVIDWLLSDNPIREAVRTEFSKTDPKAIETSLNDIQDLDFVQTLRQLTIPGLLVYGGNDPLITRPEGNQFLSPAGNAHRITLDDAGHFPMLDQENKFNRLLVDFLALQSGEPTSNLRLKEEWKRRVR